ncbi:MAG: methyltransferase domain-containing protein [Verrucomicrobia bacterium]|nr:methyltransferase domain-containing protein [Verrucomicrobiota bacterium]
MSDTDWEQRYQTGDMPWEKGEASPGLVDFLAAHPDLPRGRVLVPGCGTGHDARIWARAGFTVTGLDMAPSAVRIANEKTEEAGLEARYRLGDFLEEPCLEPFGWIFEHTLYCAIRPDQRDAYRQAVVRGLKPGGHFLAVHYLIPDEDGPPFGCTREEVVQRFENEFELLADWVPRSYSNRTGLERMFYWVLRT